MLHRCTPIFALLLACAPIIRADVVTNVWTAASGGSWTDAANWSDSDHLGRTDATAAVFDLSALPPGATVTLPHVNGGVRAHGLILGTDSSAADDTWRFDREGTYPVNTHPAFTFVVPGTLHLPPHGWVISAKASK